MDACRLFLHPKKNFLHLLTQVLDRFHEDWAFQILILRVIYGLLCPPPPPSPPPPSPPPLTTTKTFVNNNTSTTTSTRTNHIPVGSARNAAVTIVKNRKSSSSIFSFNMDMSELTLDKEEEEEVEGKAKKTLSLPTSESEHSEEKQKEDKENEEDECNKRRTTIQYETMLRTFCTAPNVQQAAMRLLTRIVDSTEERKEALDDTELVGFFVFLLVRFNRKPPQDQIITLCIQWLLKEEEEEEEEEVNNNKNRNIDFCGYLFGTLSMLTGSFVYPKTNIHQKPLVYYQYQELNELFFNAFVAHTNPMRQIHLHQLSTNTFYLDVNIWPKTFDALKILSILTNMIKTLQVSTSNSNTTTTTTTTTTFNKNMTSLLNCIRWGVKLLRNIILHDGFVSNTIRQQMLTEENVCFQSIQQLIQFSLQQNMSSSMSSSSSFKTNILTSMFYESRMGSSILFYTVQLVQHVYIERYQPTNGQIIDLSEKIMGFLMELLQTQCTIITQNASIYMSSTRAMQEMYQLTEAIGLVLTNRK
jgi:hypothetical protein